MDVKISLKISKYRGRDCMKKFCESLREHAIEISIFSQRINFKKKKMKLLTKKQKKSYEIAKSLFVKKNLKINMLKIKNIVKLGTIVIIQVNTEVPHIAYCS